MKAEGITEAMGIIRKVDELGRVTLPSEMRSELGIKERTPLHVWMQGKFICMCKQDAEKEKLQSFMEFIAAEEEFFGKELVTAMQEKLAKHPSQVTK